MQVPDFEAGQALASVIIVTEAGFMRHLPLNTLLQQTRAEGVRKCISLQVPTNQTMLCCAVLRCDVLRCAVLRTSIHKLQTF